MNLFNAIRKEFLLKIKQLFDLENNNLKNIEISLNIDKDRSFGDLNCNASMILAKTLQKNPKTIATEIKDCFLNLEKEDFLKKYIKEIQIAGPGFLNIFLYDQAYQGIAIEFYKQSDNFFKIDKQEKLKYLIEFVSANPTGPMHLGHGRNGIIGDVLSRALKFLGHDVTTEFYINDAGSQIQKLGESFKIRCFEELGQNLQDLEINYKGEYLINLAKTCVEKYGQDLLNKEDPFFQNYAKEHLLENLKIDLKNYRIFFDNWFSEKSLYESGQVIESLDLLEQKNLVYNLDGALWFKSAEFGDEKDRVLRKSDGEFTYIVGDIAYHKNKFDRGYDKIIDVLGQDHHGYVARLKSTMRALGYNADKLDVILYQLVNIKNQDQVVRMSKRAGNFTTLYEIIESVGADVARFFYLNRKAEAHLDFDLNVALKTTEENPVYYIQYAYVRINSIFQKALQEENLKDFVLRLFNKKIKETELASVLKNISDLEFDLIKKIISFQDILKCIQDNYQTHMLAYYTFELAHVFHNYYAQRRVIDLLDIELCHARLIMMYLLKNSFEICLDLLGISKPEKM
ncbi:arginine--tRNA ligase [Candidatus Babeliales bacterium]|nr:arginine--tRNA ligase [Candidatus Babeliales bacterium]